eukprot:m.259982 g.259982  ORF g.259982 m.259982 type:complete len:73 (+) comp39004_c0_seq1:1638-1856(+)
MFINGSQNVKCWKRCQLTKRENITYKKRLFQKQRLFHCSLNLDSRLFENRILCVVVCPIQIEYFQKDGGVVY